ncbi:hypothetical protein [Gemmata massiliana]|uniref:hypothetical protein n=1 Tax=Gemmata massiliana TaxID=1210884 RepID=UPI0013A68F57|nr:hypothetical protein [Gemmata massiliana]
MSDERIRERLPDRPGDLEAPPTVPLYERTAFREADRGRILELLKARGLVFDNLAPGGILVPDRLRAVDLPDEAVPDGSWKYEVEFLPEKVFLRFVAKEYDVIRNHLSRCFRNQVIWNVSGTDEVRLEAHYSPPGNTRPYILIRSATAQCSVPEKLATRIQVLLDEIYEVEEPKSPLPALVRIGEPEPVPSNIASAPQTRGLTHMNDRALPLLEPLKLFHQIGVKCLKAKRGAFSFKQMAKEGLGQNDRALRAEMIKVSRFFYDYFVKFGHPEKGNSFKTKDDDPAAWPTEKVIHCAEREKSRICEPIGRWAWELTRDWLVDQRVIAPDE